MEHDTIKVTVMPDGLVKVETDEVSQANHMNAESFLKYMAQMLGGETNSHPIQHGHTHVDAGSHLSH